MWRIWIIKKSSETATFWLIIGNLSSTTKITPKIAGNHWPFMTKYTVNHDKFNIVCVYKRRTSVCQSTLIKVEWKCQNDDHFYIALFIRTKRTFRPFLPNEHFATAFPLRHRIRYVKMQHGNQIYSICSLLWFLAVVWRLICRLGLLKVVMNKIQTLKRISFALIKAHRTEPNWIEPNQIKRTTTTTKKKKECQAFKAELGK